MKKQKLRIALLILLAAFTLQTTGGVPLTQADEPGDKAPKGSKKTKPSKKSSKGSGSKKGAKKKRKSDAFSKSKREKEFAKALGEDYEVKYTDHFFVLTNADAEIVKDFLPRLERTYQAVDRVLTKLDVPIQYPKQKLPVLFCKDREEFDVRCKQLVGRVSPAEAAGLYYRLPLNFSIFYDMSQVSFIKEMSASADQLRKEAAELKDRNAKREKLREADWKVNRIAQYQQDQNRSVVQHELAHQLLFNLEYHKSDAHNPQWFVEGMATLFEPPPGAMGAGVNVTNQRRLAVVRDSMKTLKPEDLKAFIGNPGDGAGGMLSDEGYARSWAICHFLMKRKSKEMPKYVALIRKRKPNVMVTPEQDVKDFESCFGKIDSAFVKKYSDFITKLPFRP